MFAKVSVYGVTDTIERHYQAAKLTKDGIMAGKGKPFAFLSIQGIQADKKYTTAYYKLLWYKYLRSNPDLVTYASAFDGFTDMFRGKNTVNCQADVICQYVKEGSGSILKEPDVQMLLKILQSHKAI